MENNPTRNVGGSDRVRSILCDRSETVINEATGQEKKGKYHAFAISLILLSISLAFLKFAPSGARTLQAVKDLINSFTPTPTVSQLPRGMIPWLPTSWGEAKTWLIGAGKLFITPSNVGAYFTMLFRLVVILLIIAVCLAAFGFVFVKVLKHLYASIDNEHNENSKPLQAWLKITSVIWYIPKDFLRNFKMFLVEHKLYIWIFGLIWCWNLNWLTIVIEAIAFIVYLFKSGDFLNLFLQVAKLFIDLRVSWFVTIPLGVWIRYYFFDRKRREEGFAILKEEEAHNTEVLERHPGNILFEGPPRSGKTKLSTYVQKLYARIFRRQAKKSSFDRKMQFPNFPWKILEQTLLEMRRRVETFDMTFISSFIEFMKFMHEHENEVDEEIAVEVIEALQEIGYIGHDFIFDYEVEHYPMEYNDNVRYISLWETVELYAQEFYIYTAKKPFNFGNYPMRIYTRWLDFGNYPLLDEYNNIFRATPEELEAYSEFNHKYFADMGRLGVKKNENGEYIYNFEFGVVGISEAGKEYGNQKTNQGLKAEGPCNPVNDLAVLNMKMQGQGSTVGYYPYYIIITDEQRSGSLQLDALDLGNTVRILSREKGEIKMPRFGLETRLYEWAREKTETVLDYMNVRHGKNTLLVYWVVGLYSIIHNHYVRIYNQFSSEKINVRFVSGANGEVDGSIEHFYVANREIANVYETAYFATIYQARRALSETGGNDQVPQYTTLKPEISDMRELGSHFYDKVLKYFIKEDEEE